MSYKVPFFASSVVSNMEMTTCDWCQQEAPVQIIKEELWRFWETISSENLIMTSFKNICEKCRTRFEQFSIYIERCKINAFIVDKIQAGESIEDHITIDRHPLIEKEILRGNEVVSACPSSASSKVSFKRKKPYKCEHCQKCFTQSSSLNTHSRIHTGEKPFQCPFCRKRFNVSGNLNMHIRIHTGEKSFKCVHCHKSFSQSSSLNTHLRIHTGEKPFRCTLCDKRFTVPDHLKLHLRVHSGDKPFECKYCHKTFSQVSSMRTHLRAAHTSVDWI